MTRTFGLEMLRHTTGGRPSTNWEIGEMHMRYPLNHHAKALPGIGFEFREPIENDIPTVEENLRTSSNVDSNIEEEINPA